jgi:magnesium transporter
MLILHSCAADRDEACGSETVDDFAMAELSADVIWIDLVKAEPPEIAFVERTTGLHVPSFEELSEIESSSRLFSENGATYLSTPVVYRADTGEPIVTPVGFVLTAQRLITVRFEPLAVFAAFKERAQRPNIVHPSSAGIFAGLIEALVDRMADVLERVGSELDAISHRIFRDETARAGKRRPGRENADLRALLRRVGRAGDLTSKIRDSLLGMSRIVPFVDGICAGWLPTEVKPHLHTLRQDVVSLNDYDAFLNNKVQLLLDATLGLINIEQNNIIKVLTVVSVVGVPPTFFASMYGMNFKNMPELDWAWGYPYGLTLIVVSAILPFLWFKLRGWL